MKVKRISNLRMKHLKVCSSAFKRFSLIRNRLKVELKRFTHIFLKSLQSDQDAVFRVRPREKAIRLQTYRQNMGVGI